MKTKEEILVSIKKIFTENWTTRDGTVVPGPADIKLGNDAVILDATVLYADMIESTKLVDDYKDHFAAEIYKSYLLGACEVIKNNGGEIISFDGDRVMSIFINNNKNSSATKCGLQIHALTREINSLLSIHYPKSTYRLKQAVGIDTSKIFAARTGIRNDNDIVWVGPAANYAAKLCALADEKRPTVISDRVYKMLSDKSKFGGNPKMDMWSKDIWEEKGLTIYRSTWYWEL
jgi:class 3 adenylate cyclase